jgi:spermidine synthase
VVSVASPLYAAQMIPWETLDTAPVPGGDETLRLKRRGSEYSIMLGTNELMNSRMSGSEEALARLTIESMGDMPAPKVLVGGLGMGFTLRAALALLPPRAEVTVAELVPAVVAWARGPMAELHAGSLQDPRVTIVEGDVSRSITRGAWDAILLDVDNGPEGLSRAGNDALYHYEGLVDAHRALRPGGVLSVWSSGPNRGFTRRLQQAGFKVREESIRGGRGRGARHVIWLAVAQGAGRG